MRNHTTMTFDQVGEQPPVQVEIGTHASDPTIVTFGFIVGDPADPDAPALEVNLTPGNITAIVDAVSAARATARHNEDRIDEDRRAARRAAGPRA